MDELAKQLLMGFPSFAGLVFCIWMQKQQNDRLMSLLERFCKPCEDEEPDPPK